jgi:hypothetical protein
VKEMKKFITILAVVISMLSMSMAPVFAQSTSGAQAACSGIGAAAGSSTDGCNSNTGSPSLDTTIATVINILSTVVSVIAIIMIIIGGVKYITSSGDSSNVASAKNTIIYAIVGLIVVAFAQIIVKFVLKKVIKP